MCRILIEISAGVIQAIKVDRKMQVTIVDRDCFDGRHNRGIVQEFMPEILNPSEKFSKAYAESIDEMDAVIYTILEEARK